MRVALFYSRLSAVLSGSCIDTDATSAKPRCHGMSFALCRQAGRVNAYIEIGCLPTDKQGVCLYLISFVVFVRPQTVG